MPSNPLTSDNIKSIIKNAYVRYVVCALVGAAVYWLTNGRIQLPPPPLPQTEVPVQLATPEIVIDQKVKEDAKAARERIAGVNLDVDDAPHVCGVGEQLNETPRLEARIPGPKIFWTVQPKAYPEFGLDVEDVVGAFTDAWAAWDKGAVINATYVPWGSANQPTNVASHFKFIDGPGNVLAWSELADGTKRTLTQRYDDERWSREAKSGRISMKQVAMHEIGHALGLQHDANNSGALMAPVLNSKIDEPTPRDFERLFALGYDRRVALPPPPNPKEPKFIPLPVLVKESDLIDAVRAAGHKVDDK
jgi:hypothetical protein